MAKVLDHNAAYAKDPNGSQRELEVDASGNLKTVSTGGGGDGAILDGVTSSIKATVKDYTNSNPQSVELVDTNGDPVSVGGGTQYDEDTPHVSGDKLTLAGVVQKSADAGLSSDGDRSLMQVDSNGWLKVNTKSIAEYQEDSPSAAKPTGGEIMARRADTPAAETSADRDVIALNATNKGELYVKHIDSVPVTDNAGSLTVDTPAPGLGAGLAINDNAGSITVDGPVTDAQLRASAVPVSGPLTDAQLRATAVPTQDAADIVDNAVFTDGTSKVEPAGFIFDEVAGTALTENDAAAARINANRAQVFTLEDDSVRGRRASVSALGSILVRGESLYTFPVSLATNTPDVTDRAARLLGVVDKGKLWDGTNIAAVKAASILALATDPALVVQSAPQRADAGNIIVTGTAAVNTGVTVTLGAAGAGLFHYITSIQIDKLYNVIGIAAGAGVIITSTNLGGIAWTTEQLASPAGTVAHVVNLVPATPIKSAVANTATTIVCPVQLQTIWRVNVTYYTAP